jgi:hypothetical protein
MIVGVAAYAMACRPAEPPPAPAPSFETVLTLHPSTWFEDAWRYFEVSPDATRAVYGPRYGVELLAIEGEHGTSLPVPAAFDSARLARFAPSGEVYWFGLVGGELGWYAEQDGRLSPAGVPPLGDLRISPDGRAFAHLDSSEGSLVIGGKESGDDAESIPLDGMLSALAWSADSRELYVVAWNSDGTSSLTRFSRVTGEVVELRNDLDTVWRFGALSASPDGRSLYLSLVGDGPPDIEARHLPGQTRDLDIYRFDLESNDLTPVVEVSGDDFNPRVIGDHLYWTHNEIRDSVVVLPIEGGEAHVVAEHAEIPYWSPDGGQIGVTYGGWRLADWGLNLDGGVIEVDENALPVSGVTPMIVGYHEDFSPVWSPDGRWIAYHSHRSEEPGSFYSHEGSTDSIYLRRPEAPADTEVSLFDFGWEVGNPDWSPDGRRLTFDSWDRERPGVSWPWIATIDPETGAAVSVERLPLPDEISNVSLSAWSPDGEEIAIVDRGGGTGQEIWVLAVDGSSAERLVAFEASTYGGIDWTPDGESLIFGALAGDRMQIFSVPRAGGEPIRLTDDSANLMHPQVSPDGRWIACTRMDQAKELRRIGLH